MYDRVCFWTASDPQNTVSGIRNLNMKKAFRKPKFIITAALAALCITATGCNLGETGKPAAPYDGTNFVKELDVTEAGQNPQEFAAGLEVIKNFDTKLSVPTYITKVNDTYFIVDCYHNRIIYSDSLDVPLTEWYIMSGEATQPHTLASDGTVYLVDDTENNRVLVF